MTHPYESLCISEISSSSSLENASSFSSALPPLLLSGGLPTIGCDLFFAASSSFPRLVLPSRLVNHLPSVVFILPCCVLCIPKMFWFALLLLVLCYVYFFVYLPVCHASSLSAPCLFCEKAIRMDNPYGFFFKTGFSFIEIAIRMGNLYGFFKKNKPYGLSIRMVFLKCFILSKIGIRIGNPYDLFFKNYF